MVYRNIHTSFWTDNKVVDMFSSEDKFFYLYLLTNPQTTICGCYEVSFRQIEQQTGLDRKKIEQLIEKFEKEYGVIRYSPGTKEILVLNWYKYNITKSSKTLAGVLAVAKHIKNRDFRKYVEAVVDAIKNDTEYIHHEWVIEASESDAVSEPKVKDKYSEQRKKIIDYLNTRCGTKYKPDTGETKRYINGRLEEGYTEDDFYLVIDKKSKEWTGTEYEKYLKPTTLFRPSNFESYVNQKIIKKGEQNILTDWREC